MCMRLRLYETMLSLCMQTLKLGLSRDLVSAHECVCVCVYKCIRLCETCCSRVRSRESWVFSRCGQCAHECVCVCAFTRVWHAVYVYAAVGAWINRHLVSAHRREHICMIMDIHACTCFVFTCFVFGSWSWPFCQCSFMCSSEIERERESACFCVFACFFSLLLVYAQLLQLSF
jgi:hypothetical protein